MGVCFVIGGGARVCVCVCVVLVAVCGFGGVEWQAHVYVYVCGIYKNLKRRCKKNQRTTKDEA